MQKKMIFEIKAMTEYLGIPVGLVGVTSVEKIIERHQRVYACVRIARKIRREK